MSAIWGTSNSSESEALFLKNLWNKLREWALDLWHEIPKEYQRAIVTIASAAITATGKTFGAALFDADHPCFQWACIHHTLGSSIGAGLGGGYMAYKAFFWRPGRGRAGGPSYEGS